MRAVLLSTRPMWVEKICHKIGERDGEPIYKKRIEVRKTRPKLEAPFKVYIYCTQGDSLNYLKLFVHSKINNKYWIDNEAYGFNVARANGKVIGEFICDRIDEHICTESKHGLIYMYHTIPYKDFTATCLDLGELENYGGGNPLYFWHISDLVIYDKPRELIEFHKPCEDVKNCLNKAFRESGRSLDKCFDCGCRIARSPQSWCYVEERSERE